LYHALHVYILSMLDGVHFGKCTCYSHLFSFELNELVSHNVVVVRMILYMRIVVLMGCVCVFFLIKKMVLF
jgi:hypothetical protein